MDHAKTRARLLELRREIEARHQRIGKHIDHRAEPLPADSEERAGELANRETLQEIDAGAQVELHQIDHAVARIDTGHYGSCEGCGKPISPERLQFLPFATQCVSCAGATG